MKNFNYKKLNYVDPKKWIELINLLPEEAWYDWVEKQKVSKVHAHTTNIGIIYDIDYGKDGPVRGKEGTYYKHFKDELDNIEAELIKFYGEGEILRAELARLHSKKIVNPHVDKGKSLIGNQRVHLPIITHPDVKFTVNNETIYMPPGELTEINNVGIHGVENNSNIDRIHLIVDYYVAPTSFI